MRSDTVFVVANVFPGDSMVARPAYLGRIRQNTAGNLVPVIPLQLPAGDFQFAYPRIISAGARLHLVWAEFGSRALTVAAWRALTTLPTTLWHAVLENGAWSAPERIVTAYWLGWNSDAGGIAVEGNSTLHVALWQFDIDSVPRAHDFRLARGRWEKSSLPYTGLNQATAIATHGDTIVIGLVDERLDTTRVMVVESVDHGAHWIHHRVVSERPRPNELVSHLAFAPTRDGVLLAIGVKSWGSFYLDTIRVLRLKGATGAPSTELITPPPTVDGFELAAGPCGTAVMLLRTFSLAPQVFALILRRDSSATAARPLLSAADMALFPGIIAGRHSAIATVGYYTAVDKRWQSVATTLPICP